jgi:hypothetical protein
MALIRKDVTIREDSKITKPEVIKTITNWLEEMQLEPEDINDLYYAEIFDSRDNAIYRLFSKKARDKYNMTQLVFDVILPNTFDPKQYTDEAIKQLISNDQLNKILEDYSNNLNSNEINSVISKLSDDFVSNSKDINELKDKLMSFSTQEQLNEITQLLENKVEIDRLNEIISKVNDKHKEFSELLTGFVTQDQLDNVISKSIDNIITIDDIKKSKNDISYIMKKILTLENNQNKQDLNLSLSDMVTNKTLKNILNLYITTHKLDEYLKDYILKDDLYVMFNDVIHKNEIIELERKINNISYTNEDYITQLNSITKHYNDINRDIFNIVSEIEEIKYDISDKWYCELKRQIKVLNTKLDDFTLDTDKIMSLYDANTKLISDTNFRIDGISKYISDINFNISDMVLNINQNKENVNTIFSIINNYNKENKTEIINYIKTYIEANPIKINTTVLENKISYVNELINLISARLLKLEHNDYLSANNVSKLLLIDYTSIIWKGLNNGYDEFEPCTTL